MLSRIRGWKILSGYIHHVYRIAKNWGPGPSNSLHYANNGRYFSGLSLMQNRREVHMFYLAREMGKFGNVPAERKVANFIMINEFKYGQIWKVWPSPLSLWLYSTFKTFLHNFAFLKFFVMNSYQKILYPYYAQIMPDIKMLYEMKHILFNKNYKNFR